MHKTNRLWMGALVLMGMLFGSFLLGKIVPLRNDRHKALESTQSRPAIDDYQI